MNPAAKFYALVTSATIGVMFLILKYCLPLLQTLEKSLTLAAGLAGILTSVGIYRLISKGAELIIQRFSLPKRWIFGGSYLHGTWVGYFIGRAGDKRFAIEHFDQDFDGIVINGQSFTEAGSPHADWTSVSASVDERRGRLIFSYTLTILTRPGTNVGITSFQLERPSHREPATAIAGHAQDLGDQVRVQIKEIKVSEKLIPWAKALELAQQNFP